MSNFKLTDEDIIIANQLSGIMNSTETKHQLSIQAAENLKRTVNQERLPENLPMKNPNKKVEELLQDEINQHINTNRQLMKTLNEIEAKNTELNKQIEILNKTVKEQQEELEAKEKKEKHNALKNNIISFLIAFTIYLLGLFTREARTLILSILKLLR